MDPQTVLKNGRSQPVFMGRLRVLAMWLARSNEHVLELVLESVEPNSHQRLPSSRAARDAKVPVESALRGPAAGGRDEASGNELEVAAYRR